MDWNIRETPVCFVSGESKHLGQLQSFEDHKVLYRSDTKAPLSVVGNRYQVVQPRQILEFYRDLTEKSGFELETAGVLKGGRKLWALARTGQSGVLKGSGSNLHTGSGAPRQNRPRCRRPAQITSSFILGGRHLPVINLYPRHEALTRGCVLRLSIFSGV